MYLEWELHKNLITNYVNRGEKMAQQGNNGLKFW